MSNSIPVWQRRLKGKPYVRQANTILSLLDGYNWANPRQVANDIQNLAHALEASNRNSYEEQKQ